MPGLLLPPPPPPPIPLLPLPPSSPPRRRFVPWWRAAPPWIVAVPLPPAAASPTTGPRRKATADLADLIAPLRRQISPHRSPPTRTPAVHCRDQASMATARLERHPAQAPRRQRLLLNSPPWAASASPSPRRPLGAPLPGACACGRTSAAIRPMGAGLCKPHLATSRLIPVLARTHTHARTHARTHAHTRARA